jgi:hypothetical protein
MILKSVETIHGAGTRHCAQRSCVWHGPRGCRVDVGAHGEVKPSKKHFRRLREERLWRRIPGKGTQGELAWKSGGAMCHRTNAPHPACLSPLRCPQ